MINLLLEATIDSQTWIDKNANTLTLWGLIVGIIGIIVAIFIYYLQKNAFEKQVEDKSNEQKTIVENQVQVLALEEEKMREEVKPSLYVQEIIQDRNAQWVKVIVGNTNRKSIARIISMKRISDGWILKKKPSNDITFSDSQDFILEYSVGKNPDIFELWVDIEDLYKNRYRAWIRSSFSTIKLELLQDSKRKTN